MTTFRRTLLLSLAALLLFCPMVMTAKAGDIAGRRVLGFSPDGTRFAFEEFGIEDGSGFPYANIYVIDTIRNRWVDTSPFRVRIEDDRSSLDRARRRAAAKAARMLHRLTIAPRGHALARNPVTELSADPHSVTVAISSVYPPGAGLTFTLKEFALPTRRCARYGGAPSRGFRLQMRLEDGTHRLLHKDERIPKSRGCPVNYAISDILRYRPDGTQAVQAVYVVLISVFRTGFEGPDRRFIAVGSRLRQ